MIQAQPAVDQVLSKYCFTCHNQRTRSGGLALDTLSMGMSADMEAAIAEGSTLVRVGTAIFGGRAYPVNG